MTFELTILGSSSALPTSTRFPTAHLLQVGERFFLIDCGEGTQIQLRKFGFNPARIHHIFISHLHGDHVFGLFGLLSTLGMMGRKVPMNLFGPQSLEKMMHQHLAFFGPLPFPLNFRSPGTGSSFPFFTDDKVEVTAIPLTHRTDTFGYLFREVARPLNVRKDRIEEHGLGIADVVRVKQGEDFIDPAGQRIPNRKLTLPPYRQRSYAYLSDTLYDPSLSDKVKGVDLLFHEATFSRKDAQLAEETRHSTTVQAAEVARRADAGKLLIGHFSTRYREKGFLEAEAREVFPRTQGVRDGDCFSVPLQRQTSE